MKFFEYEKNNLKLNKPGILLVHEFKEVWDSDKSRDKKNAFKVFQYIYLVADWNSPYVDYLEAEKHKSAMKDAGLTQAKVSDLKDALKKYEEIQNSNRIIRYIKSTWKMLDELENYGNNVNLTETVDSGPRKGSLVHSVKDVRDTVKQMEELIHKAKGLREVLKEEMKEETKSRGNTPTGYFN